MSENTEQAKKHLASLSASGSPYGPQEKDRVVAIAQTYALLAIAEALEAKDADTTKLGRHSSMAWLDGDAVLIEDKDGVTGLLYRQQGFWSGARWPTKMTDYQLEGYNIRVVRKMGKI